MWRWWSTGTIWRKRLRRWRHRLRRGSACTGRSPRKSGIHTKSTNNR
ncbi:unnamed protein product [Strongylus vulgaris]|uniref:Uncharacterized protein n=1 Tax=Strongylus vulgaris TaxID=40348 RepID=A0A3P7IFL6_STRVU|nr:unnamed protein product [Strongylus vulgaris]